MAVVRKKNLGAAALVNSLLSPRTSALMLQVQGRGNSATSEEIQSTGTLPSRIAVLSSS